MRIRREGKPPTTRSFTSTRGGRGMGAAERARRQYATPSSRHGWQTSAEKGFSTNTTFPASPADCSAGHDAADCF
jgi:hypothetical protein